MSISLAHSAVFLLGDADRTVEPIRVLLNSGDVIIMTGSCRQRFHAVPKIFITDNMTKKDFISASESYQKCLEESDAGAASVENESDGILASLSKFTEEDVDKAIQYIKTRRINLNVRQLKAAEDEAPFGSDEIDPRLLDETCKD